MAEDAKIGYNYIAVNNLFNEVDEVATQTKRIVSKYLNEDLIDPMSKLWYAPEAKEFFNKFKGVVEDAEKKMDGAFQSFINNIDGAQEAWSKKTGGGEKAKVIQIQTEKIFLNTAKFKEQKDGNIYIDERGALNYAEGLSTLQQKMTNDLIDQQAELTEASLAFIGNNQAEDIQKCFEKVISSIGEIFDFLDKGDNSLKAEIIRVTEEYRNLALKIREELEGKK